jgi:cell wall-associated NlpC family hydrolase
VLKKVTVIATVTIMMFTSTVCVSYADKYGSSDLAGAKQQTSSAKSKLDAAKQAEAGVQADIDAIQKKINASVARISSLNNKIAKAEQKMEALSEKLFNLEEQLSTQQGDLSTWLRQMYLTGNTNMIDVLLASDSFEDLIGNLDMVKRVYDLDMKIIKEIETKQKQIENKKKELKTTNKSLKKQKNSVEQEKKGLTEDQQVLETELEKAGQSTETAKKAYENAMSSQSSIAASIARQNAYSSSSSSGSSSSSSSSSPSYSSNPGESLNDSDFQKILAEANKHLGKRYSFGASGPNSFDCSGFVCYVYSHALGVGLPRSAQGMCGSVKKVSGSDRAPGDLVFFTGTSSHAYISHVGIYVGGGRMIHASSGGGGVMYSSLDDSYYSGKIYCYGRV